MPELIHRERLQPSLLDRLTDADREGGDLSRERGVLTLAQIRESVRRDLGWLFNCVHMAAIADLSRYPEIARSVLNFGIPDLAGRTAGSILNTEDGVEKFEQLLRQAILDFEPRLLPNTVRVRLVATEAARHNSLQFVVEAELWAQPVPLPLLLRTQIDLEDGKVAVADVNRQD